MGEATLEQWREDIRRAALDGAEQSPGPVYCAGLSMGALLALDLAAKGDFPIGAIAALAPPLGLGAVGRYLGATAQRLSWLRNAAVPKRGGPDIANGTPLAGAAALPLRGVHQLYRLIDDVADSLAKVIAPLLIVHARQDHTAPVEGAYRLAAEATAAASLRLVILERSFHVITRDVESGRVSREVSSFFERCLRAAN